MIIPVSVQLKGETQPQRHLALVFPDAMLPADLIPYRNAATTVAKEVLTNSDIGSCLNDECFWLVQFAEFISTSLDAEYESLMKR